MCPQPTSPASYLLHDAPDVAPLRARLRLRMTGLHDDHLLRRTPGATTMLVAVSPCAACRSAPETADHVLLHCTHSRLQAARERCRAQLDALRLPLTLGIIAGITPTDRPPDDGGLLLSLAFTAELLTAARLVTPFMRRR